MIYRIRYRSAGGDHEARVEAHSPAEAVVKFRSTGPSQGEGSAGQVRSVTAEPALAAPAR